MLEVVPEKWITYDGTKMFLDGAGKLPAEARSAPKLTFKSRAPDDESSVMRAGTLLVLSLALAASDASAADLYRWVTKDGRVEIGTMPPPGVDAVPWRPGQAEPPAPAAPAAEASPDVPRSGRARAAEDLKRERCRRVREEARELASSILKKEAEIEALEARAAQLEATEVAYSRVDCRNDAQQGDRQCESSVFDRDKEIAKVEQKVGAAREQLDELEQKSRAANLADCEEPAAAR